MNGRGLTISAALLAVLGGLLWWSNRVKAKEVAKPSADAPPKILTLAEGDIQKLDLKKKDGDAIVYGKYGTNKFPETWIIDKHGIIRARFDGAKEWSGAAVVELVDQLRNDGYCPVEVSDGRTSGEAARMCDDPAGGG